MQGPLFLFPKLRLERLAKRDWERPNGHMPFGAKYIAFRLICNLVTFIYMVVLNV